MDVSPTLMAPKWLSRRVGGLYVSVNQGQFFSLQAYNATENDPWRARNFTLNRLFTESSTFNNFNPNPYCFCSKMIREHPSESGLPCGI
ncbi:MAG: hypothetical protein ACPGOY_03200 [Rhodospirillaceae bacterium]